MESIDDGPADYHPLLECGWIHWP